MVTLLATKIPTFWVITYRNHKKIIVDIFIFKREHRLRFYIFYSSSFTIYQFFNFDQFSFLSNLQFRPISHFVPFSILSNFVHFSVLSIFQFCPFFNVVQLFNLFNFVQLTILSNFVQLFDFVQFTLCLAR